MAGRPGPLELEFLLEQARALTRATELLEDALRGLARVGLPSSTASSIQDRERADALEHARERLWHVLVQRESMGIVHHQALYEVLSIPAEVRSHPAPRTIGCSGDDGRRTASGQEKRAQDLS